MVRDLELAVGIKRQVESIECPNCKDAKLIFKSVEFDEAFEFKQGESMVVDADCMMCNEYTTLILKVKVDGHLE